MLWSALRRNAVAHLHFRRQQVIAGFIADFYCAAARLVVEIDGGSHLIRKEYDSRRDKVFSELGIRTLRLSSESFARDFTGVLRLIEKEPARPLRPVPKSSGDSHHPIPIPEPKGWSKVR